MNWESWVWELENFKQNWAWVNWEKAEYKHIEQSLSYTCLSWATQEI